MIRARRLSIGLQLLPLVIVGACASGPVAPQPADQDAKRFDRPAPDKGALYIYRPGWMALTTTIDVAIVGGANAQLGSNTYVRLEGPPGPVEIQDGQTRFVEVSVKVGWWTPGCEIAEVPPDQGQAAVLASKRIEPK